MIEVPHKQKIDLYYGFHNRYDALSPPPAVQVINKFAHIYLKLLVLMIKMKEK